MPRKCVQKEFRCFGHDGVLGPLENGKYPFTKTTTGTVVMLPKDYVDGRYKADSSSKKPQGVTSLNQGRATI